MSFNIIVFSTPVVKGNKCELNTGAYPWPILGSSQGYALLAGNCSQVLPDTVAAFLKGVCLLLFPLGHGCALAFVCVLFVFLGCAAAAGLGHPLPRWVREIESHPAHISTIG